MAIIVVIKIAIHMHVELLHQAMEEHELELVQIVIVDNL